MFGLLLLVSFFFVMGGEWMDGWGRTRGLAICDAVGEDLGEVEEDTAALVEDLDARFDFEVLADGDVERVEGWFAFPEEVWDVEDV